MGTDHGKGARMARRVRTFIESRVVFALGVLVLLLWALPVTRVVYVPHAVEIHGDQVTMHRSFPMDALGLPRPKMAYVETVRPLTLSHNGGQPCTDRGGPFQYSRTEDVGSWSIEWAADCLSDPVGFVWYARWTWHIGGLKLGPVSLTHTVLK